MKRDVPVGPARGGPQRGAWLRCPCICLSLLCMCASGCSDLANVSGAIKLDDKTLVGGRDYRVTVIFVPESGSGATAAGLVDEQGQYTISTGAKTGVQPGAYLVGVSAVEVLRSNDPSAPPGGRRVTPQIYADPKRSGLRADVQSGSNTFDFNLRSDAGRSPS